MGAFYTQHVISDGFVEFLKPRMRGSNYPAVQSTDVEAYTLPLPPLPEQRKIATILSCLDDSLEKNQATIGRLQALKGGLMALLLTGELRVTPDGEAA